jgi:uncharacterized protein (TIGR02145 family)
MKKLTLTLIAIVAMLAAVAQAPYAFNYQTAVRNADGNIMADQSVAFQISILQGATDGTAVYVETHAATTNAHGLVNFQIGGGTTTDDFSAIDWAAGPYFVKVELDAAGGTTFVEMGTSQLLSVPYVKYAETTGDAAALMERLAVLEEMSGIGTITDIDGNEYEITKIGNQIWMAENLRVTKYADGTPLEYIADSATWNDNLTNTTKAYAFPNYNEANANTYGALYTWYGATNGDSVSAEVYQVQGACPDGWHIPSNDEFAELVDYLANHGFAGTEAIALKSTTGWEEDGNGTDDYGFNWLPAGLIQYSSGAYNRFGKYDWFWSSSKDIETLKYKAIASAYNLDIISFVSNYNNGGHSIRCLRD